MKTMEIKEIIDGLPHAFDDLYWNMANTTYKEEVFLSIVRALKIPQQEALKHQSKIFPKNKLIRQILKEEVIECMGSYGAGFMGTSFYGTYSIVYNGRGTTKVINN